MAAPGSTPAAAPGTLILAIFTAIRLVLVLDLIPAALSESLASPALASALVNPLHTVHHLREGNFLLELAASAAGEGNGSGTFDQAYEGMVFHLPPLVLLLFRPTFALVASKDVQDAIIGVSVPNLTGGLSAMMPNHHISKPVLIGEIQDDGQFEVVSSTSGLVVGDAWSDY